MTATVLTVGSLHYDIMVEADHLPRRDETAIGSRWYPKFGGKGGNQAAAIARAGVPSRMAGAIGNDDFGRFLRNSLREAGVEERFVLTLPDAPSGMSVALLDRLGDYAATIVSGANLRIDPASLSTAALWQDVALLVLQNEVSDAVNLAAATLAARRGLPVILNAAPYRPLPPALMAHVTHLVVNAVEAEMLGAASVATLAAAAAAARHLGGLAPHVTVTAGSLGLAAATGGTVLTIPAEKVKVVSSHGAGDAFIGAFAAALVAATPLPEALARASSAAAAHVAGR